MTLRDENYFTDKYGMTRTHSEVLHAATLIAPGKALDLGCGNGRNSLYLAANGFDITAWDKNPASISNLERIRQAEGLENLRTAIRLAFVKTYIRTKDLEDAGMHRQTASAILNSLVQAGFLQVEQQVGNSKQAKIYKNMDLLNLFGGTEQ